jgi:2-keto-4-pentenoate hydratase/2-oxohepta-3-ene-1,7-dioic acid hydratase in catechol pathway
MNFVFSQKNWDTSASLGPWIVTAEEIGDPHDLSLKSRVNGELRQNSNTSDMVWRFPEIIEFFSRDQTVHSGDIFTSGTPSGVGAEKADGSWFLEPGDVVEAEVEGIGILRNHIVPKKS